MNVNIKSSEQPRFYEFGWGVPSLSATAVGDVSRPLYKESIFTVHQAVVKGTSGAQAATVLIEGTMDPLTGQGLQALISTTNASATITSKARAFLPAMNGMLVMAPGVPLGSTFTYASASSGTLSIVATATAEVQAEFYDLNWVTLGTITLSGTIRASDGFATMAPWRWTRVTLTAISGTGAAVQVIMGC